MDELRNLRRLAYFAAVVETGSFTAAAERLGITKAVVSQQVAKLEAEFRATLLIRTTRKVQPTDAGQIFYQRCLLILKEAQDAFDELSESATEPSGSLKLTAPLDYGMTVVVPTITRFVERFPACRAELLLNDQTLDLVENSIELAVRVGWLSDSSLQARRIGSFRQLLVAAPALKLDRLSGPEDIETLPFIANTALKNPLVWHFSLNDIERRAVTLRSSIFIDATLAVLQAVRLGAGVSILPDFAVVDDLAAGRLVQLLPRWSLPSGGVHVTFPVARFRSAKVRAFTDLLAQGERERQDAISSMLDTPATAPRKSR